jgi:hypothetical protein
VRKQRRAGFVDEPDIALRVRRHRGRLEHGSTVRNRMQLIGSKQIDSIAGGEPDVALAVFKKLMQGARQKLRWVQGLNGGVGRFGAKAGQS